MKRSSNANRRLLQLGFVTLKLINSQLFSSRRYTSLECLFVSCVCLLLFVACLTLEILRFACVYVTFAPSEYRASRLLMFSHILHTAISAVSCRSLMLQLLLNALLTELTARLRNCQSSQHESNEGMTDFHTEPSSA